MRIEQVVGQRVRERREALGLTQFQLGGMIGPLLGRPWSRQAVSAAEKGDRSFGAADMVALAKILRTTVADLFRPPADGQVIEVGVVGLTGAEVAALTMPDRPWDSEPGGDSTTELPVIDDAFRISLAVLTARSADSLAAALRTEQGVRELLGKLLPFAPASIVTQ